MNKEKLDEEKLKKEFYEIKIKEILEECKEDLNLVKKDDPIDKVLSTLKKINHIWVVDDLKNKKLLGVISRIDLLHLLAPPKSLYHIFSIPESYHHGTIGEAEDIMDPHYITCEHDEKIVDVLRKMIRHNSEKLAIITDNGEIEGEINLKHLICHYYDEKLNKINSIKESIN